MVARQCGCRQGTDESVHHGNFLFCAHRHKTHGACTCIPTHAHTHTCKRAHTRVPLFVLTPTRGHFICVLVLLNDEEGVYSSRASEPRGLLRSSCHVRGHRASPLECALGDDEGSSPAVSLCGELWCKSHSFGTVVRTVAGVLQTCPLPLGHRGVVEGPKHANDARKDVVHRTGKWCSTLAPFLRVHPPRRLLPYRHSCLTRHARTLDRACLNTGVF
jgi:hypothetical protein